MNTGMKNLLFFLMGIIHVCCVQAAVVERPLMPIKIDLHDKAKLQRGARLFMNYCSGCHSLRYMRYNQMGKDLGITTFTGEVDTDLLKNNLIFTTSQPLDPIKISMPEVDAREWFGKPPPDLSLTGRERGANWLYTYLHSFYLDKKRPFGTNNLLIPDVAMPNILSPLQGEVVAIKDNNHLATPSNTSLLLIEKGEMTQQQFDSALQDIVTFLVYVSEPAKLQRFRIGTGVLLFLAILLILAYQLKRSYWQDIH
jgi:ubiquinol-cytochrome c reductase cytochrome c1 subunit